MCWVEKISLRSREGRTDRREVLDKLAEFVLMLKESEGISVAVTRKLRGELDGKGCVS